MNDRVEERTAAYEEAVEQMLAEGNVYSKLDEGILVGEPREEGTFKYVSASDGVLRHTIHAKTPAEVQEELLELINNPCSASYAQ